MTIFCGNSSYLIVFSFEKKKKEVMQFNIINKKKTVVTLHDVGSSCKIYLFELLYDLKKGTYCKLYNIWEKILNFVTFT